MHCKQDNQSVLASKPSSSFSTVSSAASATSAATSRSGGSRLLFGEIDTSSDRSSESYASVCSFVLCDSSTILKFWLEDRCRDTLLSFLPKDDLASLRLACHDFSVRAAPALFSDLNITFQASKFTKPAKLAALDRLGFYVKTLHFNVPHSNDTFLPPLIDPETGAELSFTYTPQTRGPSSTKQPKYGDVGTTEILTRQYPPLFHAATNVPAFIRAFSAFVNLEHLAVHCPGYDCTHSSRRSTVDYALISLRIAIERNCLNALETLTLSPMHPGGLIYLAPMLGFGASPRSAGRWRRIRHLNLHLHNLLAVAGGESKLDQVNLLQTYLHNFQPNLETFSFCWIGQKGYLPVKPRSTTPSPSSCGRHPAHIEPASSARPLLTSKPRTSLKPLHFPRLKRLHIENVSTTAADINTFIAAHKATIEDLDLQTIDLTQGTWDDALATLASSSASTTKRPQRRKEISSRAGDIPIMLSPSTKGEMLRSSPACFPMPMERVEVSDEGGAAGRTRSIGELCGRKKTTPPTTTSSITTARRVREGLLGCEQQLRKVFRGSAMPWR